MSTDPSIESKDLSVNQDGVATEANAEAIKSPDQSPPAQSTDNTADNPEVTSTHITNQNFTHEEITEDTPDTEDDHNASKDEELNTQERPTNLPTVVNDQASNTKSSSLTESVSTSENDGGIIRRVVRQFPGITQIDRKIAELTEQNKQLCSEVELLKERMATLEESAKFKFDELIKEAISRDDATWDEDNDECQKYIGQAKLWRSKVEVLYTSVLATIADCGHCIDQCGNLMQEINRENSTLYKSLLNRYESLELSKRMLERLREPIELLKKPTLPSEQLLRLQEQELVDLLRSQNDKSEAKKVLDQKVKETGDNRYKSVREWRDLSEKLQKQWLNFIEKKLLPVPDGIDDVKIHAEHLVDELKSSYQIQSCQDNLSAWLQAYVDVENILVDCLRSIGVNQISVERGQPVDYDRHEPLTTEPDPDLPYESIKEVTRNGYEYRLNDQAFILRSAQVIVVKNN